MLNLNNSHVTPKVFFLDDDVFFLEYIKQKANAWVVPSQFSFFSTIEELKSRLEEHADVFVLDFNLGFGKDGPLYAHEILEDILGENPAAKIIFVSGMENDEVLFEYARFRNVEFLSKSSFELDRLGNLIGHYLTQKKIEA